MTPQRPATPVMAPEDEVLSTLDSKGKRKWMYPRIEKTGRFLKRRRLVAYLLIAFFVILPWLRMPNGHELFLFNLIERKFVFLGMVFNVSDSPLLAVLLLICFASIFFLTALLGRMWCGWMCPQTVYLEFVYRPIERWATGKKGVGGKPIKAPAYRRAIQVVLYVLISFGLSNVFLSYFVGTDILFGEWLSSSPFKHPGGFFIVLLVTGMMLFDFGFWREQMCTLACPYGRLQSAMLDKHSCIVAYDKPRGEPRGKPRRAKKGASIELPQLGDCIDCNMCVQACPTGIDIRDGLQLECLHCTACIDACDKVMAQVKRDIGLIRYTTQAALAGEKSCWIRPRTIIYPLIIFVLSAVLLLLVSQRVGFNIDTSVSSGESGFSVMEDTSIENRFRLLITNRTDSVKTYKLSTPKGTPYYFANETELVEVAPQQTWQENTRLLSPPDFFTRRRMPVILKVTEIESGKTRTTRTLISGPVY